MQKALRVWVYGIFAAACIGLFLQPQICAAGVQNALLLCAKTLVPSLFPFLVLSGFFLRSGLCTICGARLSHFTTRLFRLPGESAGVLLLSMVGGFPVGIKMTANLFANGQNHEAASDSHVPVLFQCRSGVCPFRRRGGALRQCAHRRCSVRRVMSCGADGRTAAAIHLPETAEKHSKIRKPRFAHSAFCGVHAIGQRSNANYLTNLRVGRAVRRNFRLAESLAAFAGRTPCACLCNRGHQRCHCRRWAFAAACGCGNSFFRRACRALSGAGGFNPLRRFLSTLFLRTAFECGAVCAVWISTFKNFSLRSEYLCGNGCSLPRGGVGFRTRRGGAVALRNPVPLGG